jgi:hypothetical protein
LTGELTGRSRLVCLAFRSFSAARAVDDSGSTTAARIVVVRRAALAARERVGQIDLLQPPLGGVVTPIIKPRTRGKHFVEHRTRLDRDNHETLYAYAAFVDEDPEYVLNQLVETVLGKDKDFLAWRATHTQLYAPGRSVRTVGIRRRSAKPAQPLSGGARDHAHAPAVTV